MRVNKLFKYDGLQQPDTKAAYLEAVRAEVRTALEEAGYPDTDRVIEVYSDIACSE